jgi:hypothetical protein
MMKNRVAWGLTVVAIGAAALFVSYQNRLPERSRWATLLPPSEWGFGSDASASIWSDRYRDAGADGNENYRLGFFQIRAKSPTQ